MAPASALASSRTVCVMDSSGHLDVALVKKLLNMGYIVHAATSNRGEYNRLEGLSSKNKMLKAFRSDLFDYHSIVEALNGCSGLFYNFKAAQSEQSSYDLWYALAKTLAEKTAWSLAMDRGVHMVSINAGLLIGPELSAMSPLLKGASEMYKNGVLVLVDVDFLVDAQICSFESPSTYGRYLYFNHVVNCPEDAIKLAPILVPSALGASPSDGMSVIQQRIHNKNLKMVMGFHSTGGTVAAVH